MPYSIPTPFATNASVAPRYPIEAFPVIIRNAINEVWEHIKAADALVCMAMLESMSTSAQGLYDVRLPSGQCRPVSLNVLAIADSGDRKTSVHNVVAAPLYDFDRERLKKHKLALQTHAADYAIWKLVDNCLRRKIAQALDNDESISEFSRELSEHMAKEPIVPKERRIMRQDATGRSVMDALEGDGESIAFICDEGEVIIKGGALRLMGLLNKAWDGAPMLTLDRSNGVSVAVCNPRVVVSLMVQYPVLQDLLDKRGKVLRGSGFWARYLIGYPESTIGKHHVFNLDQKKLVHLPKFHERMRELLDEFAQRIDDGNLIKHTELEFSDDAKALWLDVGNQIESMLHPLGYLHDIKDFASKSLEIAGRVAALLHVFSKQEGKISKDTLNSAVTIMGWHQQEFKRIFSPQSIPQEQLDAQVLEYYLTANYWSRGFSSAQKNLVLRNGPVRPAACLDAALNCLVNKGVVWMGVTIGSKRTHYINLNLNNANPGLLQEMPSPMRLI